MTHQPVGEPKSVSYWAKLFLISSLIAHQSRKLWSFTLLSQLSNLLTWTFYVGDGFFFGFFVEIDSLIAFLTHPLTESHVSNSFISQSALDSHPAEFYGEGRVSFVSPTNVFIQRYWAFKAQAAYIGMKLCIISVGIALL